MDDPSAHAGFFLRHPLDMPLKGVYIAVFMTASNRDDERVFDSEFLDLSFRTLAVRLTENNCSPVDLVVCGGSALILDGQLSRTTKDVDVVALIQKERICSPDPLPKELVQAARETAEDLNLPEDWLNNGPSRGVGGLFQMGLPEGLETRLHLVRYGDLLAVHFIDRYDQIHFKLYAAADRGGYHIEDLRVLKPRTEELAAAAQWAMSHDVSEGFAMVLRTLLRSLGYEDVADSI